MRSFSIDFRLFFDWCAADLCFLDAALASTGWLALQRRRALSGDTLAARLVTAFFPARYGFEPNEDWVEGVLWLSPSGARTGLHRDDEPCLVLHQLHGTKRVLLYSPDQADLLSPKPSTHSLDEHGTRYSTLPFPFEDPPAVPAVGLTVVMEAGDSLLIPNGWWHAVEALSDSVSIGGRGLTLCEGLAFAPWWMAQLAEELLGEGNGWMAVRLGVAGVCAGLLGSVAMVAVADSSRGSSGSRDNGEGEGGPPSGVEQSAAEFAAERAAAQQLMQRQQQEREARPRAAEASATAAANTATGRCLIGSGVVSLLWLLLAYISAVVIAPTYPVPTVSTPTVQRVLWDISDRLGVFLFSPAALRFSSLAARKVSAKPSPTG